MSVQRTYRGRGRATRRGAIAVLAAVMMIVMMAFVAFAVDLGYMCVVRNEAQNAADSAALAGGQELISEQRLRGDFYDVYYKACNVASQYTARHKVGPKDAYLRFWEDVAIGTLNDPTNRNEQVTWNGVSPCNAMTVTVRATRERGRESPFFFASVFGLRSFDMQASATVAFADRIAGFRSHPAHSTTSLLPFTLKIEDWKNLLASGCDDQWMYDPSDGSVTPGQDGVPELVMYPVDSGSGNWGTVDIGGHDNSTSDLVRQIEEGVSRADLDAIGGALELDRYTGLFLLNGETGMSVAIKSALANIIGKGRTIPLYVYCEGTGDTLNYQIGGFAGIRIVDFSLTGNNKYVRIQPAFVVDPTAFSQSWAEESYFIVQPARLVR